MIGPEFDTKFEEFLIVVLFAPLLETLIFQYSIISYILGRRSNAYLFACIFSAALFGLSHFYSPEYILKTFFSGLIFGTLYLVAQNKNNNAFIVVAVTHSLYNFIIFFLRLI
ncbi:MAG: CPBP family intramembrane metalloprotease [Sediminibacterium sp.]|nr:CPBP family intramembrane metalloprotease [Sediminibacterium sp.]